MPAPTKPQLSPAELAQLEHAFATDPNSEAYRPLAEAYLSMGRFMEAMVVCKKGVKAHPERADPRVLLARVYADQGKDRKALEELEAALGNEPNDLISLQMASSLLLKAGDNEKGKDYLLRAHKAAPENTDTRELLAKWKIEPPAPPAPPPPPVVVQPVAPPPNQVAGGQAMPQAGGRGAPQLIPGQPPSGRMPPPGYPQTNGQHVRTTQYGALDPNQVPGGDVPQPGYAPRPTRQRPALDLSRFEESDEPPPRSNAGALLFMGSIVLAIVVLAGYFFWTRHVKQQRAAISDALHETAEAVEHDSYSSYKKACEAAERVIKIEPDSVAGHSYLAYAYAIRWGEHGEGDTAKQQAMDHLERAKRLHQEHSHLLAAEALITFFGGDPGKAQTDLEKQVADLEAKNKASALVYETLGIIQMRNGDLDKASASLGKALNLAPADPRVNAALGDLYRRRGQEMNAWNSYDNALRYERDHADALLGKALLVLEAEHPDYTIAEQLIKKVRDADPPPSPREQAMAYLLDGLRLNQTNHKAEGLAQEEKALSIDPNNPEIRVLRGRRMLADGKSAEGLAEIKKAIDLDPRRASFYVELARAQMSMPNGAKDAIASLNTALKTLPNSSKLMTLLGQAYIKAGDPKSAQSTFEKIIATDPQAKLGEAREALADLYRRNKDWKRAQDLYDRAALDFAGTNSKVAEVLGSEAQMLEEQGEQDPQKILEAYNKALTADATFPPNYYFVGKFLAGNRKARDKAKEALDQYLKMDPKGPYAADADKLSASLH